MKLYKITKAGSLYFKLDDGRIGVTYKSGYVRLYNAVIQRMWQINKKVKIPNGKVYFGRPDYNYKRILINDCNDRIQFLLDYNNKNCKNEI